MRGRGERVEEGEGAVLLVGGEGGGSEQEEGDGFSVSVSPALCRLQNERSCFPLSLRGNCIFFVFLFFLFLFFLHVLCLTSVGVTEDLLPFHHSSFWTSFPHSCVNIFVCLGSTMPVVGVASKLRQPSAMGTKPIHTALPIPSAMRAATSQGYMARQQELRAGEGAPGLSCQLSIKSEFQQERTSKGKSRAETEESNICKVSGDGLSCCVYLLHPCAGSIVTLHRCQGRKNQTCRACSLSLRISVSYYSEQVSV